MRDRNASISVGEIFPVPDVRSEKGIENEPIESYELSASPESNYDNAETDFNCVL